MVKRSRTVALLLMLTILGSMFLGAAGGTRAQDEAATQTAEAEEAGVAESEPVEGKTNITWWSISDPAFVTANKAWIEAFEAVNPDIKVVYQHFPYDVLVRKLQTAFATDEAPDMIQMFGTWVPDYAQFDLLDPVPGDMAAAALENYFPAATAGYTYNDKLYGLANEFNIEAGGMLLNPAMFAAAGIEGPPATWQELIDDAKLLTKASEDGKTAEQIGYGFSAADPVTFQFLSMIVQQGETYWAEDGVHVNFSTDAAKKAFQDLTDLVTVHKVENKLWYNGEPWEAFFAGRIAMAHHGPWTIAAGQNEFPDFVFEYVPVPIYAGDTFKFVAESGWGATVNAAASDEAKAAAWKFIDFTHQPDQALAWNLTTFTLPAQKAMASDPALLEAIPEFGVQLPILEYGQWVGPVRNRDLFWETIFNAFLKVSLGEATSDEALAEAEQLINAMVDEALGP